VTRRPLRPLRRRKSGLKDVEEESSLNKDRACGSAGVALRARYASRVAHRRRRRRRFGFASRRRAHNVHQLNRYTTPEKHSSVCRRRRTAKAQIRVKPQRAPPPAPRSTHSSDAAASGANCGIARNRSTGRGVAPWDTSRASCTIMPLRLPSIRPFLLFSSCIRARVRCCCLMSRAPRRNEGSDLGLGRS